MNILTKYFLYQVIFIAIFSCKINLTAAEQQNIARDEVALFKIVEKAAKDDRQEKKETIVYITNEIAKNLQRCPLSELEMFLAGINFAENFEGGANSSSGQYNITVTSKTNADGTKNIKISVKDDLFTDITLPQNTELVLIKEAFTTFWSKLKSFFGLTK